MRDVNSSKPSKTMKITVGLGSVDDYPAYVRAGADELFCGYIPQEWLEKYGMFVPMNRREVYYYNVQIGSFSELMILRDMMEDLKVPVALTLNSPFYLPEQYSMIREYMLSCIEEGFHSFILADPALLYDLNRNGITEKCRIHISGECSEVNHLMIREMAKLGADRIIFHRHVTLREMEECTRLAEQEGIPLEYEAFALNEKCCFHGAFCSSLHCDELNYSCMLPYRIESKNPAAESDTAKSDGKTAEDIGEAQRECLPGILTGAGGCALCRFPQLKRAGITHLKLVSRGNYTDQTIEDISAMKKALEILYNESEKGKADEEISEQIRRKLFPDGCSRNCYGSGETP